MSDIKENKDVSIELNKESKVGKKYLNIPVNVITHCTEKKNST